ncbi:DUF2238 domain-containing protein [Bacillus ndiopicus]|uniref:DUF2238 domain-containing protein n=1 Tax=Bacillus ndiopicus TaxID=1347368 RepID=UPI0005A8C915|nr:DUF2238 domain-containing protein [Bacillus ndiopicus]
MNKIHGLLLAVVAIVLLWSSIRPFSYSTWLVEVGPAVVIIIILLITYSKFRFTTLSYCIIAFLSILTFIGGHYTYEEVPLFNWLKEEFHLKRNDYDRFGHFFKGLMAIVLREILLHFTPLKPGAWLSTISVSMVLAIAALYEILEWLSTKIAPHSKTSKDFLGMQGDKWDAQWDMTFAFLGAILAILLLSHLHDRILQKKRE